MDTAPSGVRPARSWGRRANVTAALLALLLLAAIEGALRLFGFGAPSGADPLYLEAFPKTPLFVLNEAARRYEVAVGRRVYFSPVTFPAVKDPAAFRVFCLGGSTVQGRPYGPRTSFTAWLRLNLAAAAPQRTWEVINCGGVSYASYRLAPLVREVLTHQPDLLIVYMGHNEFIEERAFRAAGRFPGWVRLLHRLVVRLRMYNLLQRGGARLFGPGPRMPRNLMPAEVHAILDSEDAWGRYRPDETWRQGAVRHFGHHLRDMVGAAGEAGVPLLLVNPVANLKDCPPFKSVPGACTVPEPTTSFGQAYLAACDPAVDPSQRVVLLREVVARWPGHAGAWYRLGLCLLNQGRHAEAERALVRAKDTDVLPLRILEPMRRVLRAAWRDASVEAVDAQRLFGELSPAGIPGREWLLDHVHPSVGGHQKLAEEIFRVMVRRGWVEPVPGWLSMRDRLYREQTESLDEAYFVRGQERLDRLRIWTRQAPVTDDPRRRRQ
jgi:lysophospholipase L1-like esterase